MSPEVALNRHGLMSALSPLSGAKRTTQSSASSFGNDPRPVRHQAMNHMTFIALLGHTNLIDELATYLDPRMT
jgi:hypothetical protein